MVDLFGMGTAAASVGKATMGTALRIKAAMLVAAVIAGAAAPPPGTARTPTTAPATRKGPLAHLPAKPGPHIQKIKALADNAWLNLGSPVPDPKWGKARGRAWGQQVGGFKFVENMGLNEAPKFGVRTSYAMNNMMHFNFIKDQFQQRPSNQVYAADGWWAWFGSINAYWLMYPRLTGRTLDRTPADNPVRRAY